MKRLTLFLLLLAGTTYAQNPYTVDSILSKADIDDTSSIHQVVQALDISRTIEYEKGEAKAYHYLGYVYNIKGNFSLSMEKYRTAEQLYKSIGDNEKRAHVQINLAYLYNRLQDHDQETLCAIEAIKITEKDSIKAYGWNCIGRAQMALGRIDSAFNCFTRAIEIKEKFGQTEDIHDFLNSMGNALIKGKKYDSAIAVFWRIQGYANDRPKVLARMFNNIGVCHHLLNQYQMAELNYLESIALAVKAESGGACLNYAELLHQMGQPEKAKSYLAKGLQFDYDLGHLGRTLHAMKMFEQSSNVRDCLYVHATRDFEKLRAHSVSVAMIESDLRNAREKAALHEANKAKTDLLITILAVTALSVAMAVRYFIKCYRSEKVREFVKRQFEKRFGSA
jgi:tetratricopeptide (TPR) repeat protein